jgi:hypothetical protein
MKECVCKIYSDNPGTGFFTKIENISVLITNNHVLKKGEIKKKEKLYILLVMRRIQDLLYMSHTQEKYMKIKT